MDHTLNLSLQANIEPKPLLRDISIVIPTLGRPILEQCLSCIVRGTTWPGGLIVVDQGCKVEVEGWIQRIRGLGIDAHYIPSSQTGRAAGLNRGFQEVRSRYVAITDDDCFVEANWLEKMYGCQEKYPESIVTGRVEAVGEGILFLVTGNTPVIYRRPRLKFDNLSGGNMSTSMEVIWEVGGFDEDLRLATAEDAEWSYRALRKGISIVYDPQVVVHHYGWRDMTNLSRQLSNYARSHGGFYGKYLRRGDLFILLRAVLHHYRALRWWLRGLTTRDAELTMSGKAYLTGLLPGILAGLRNAPARDIAG
jgi:GT2 family glycosyltransferase